MDRAALKALATVDKLLALASDPAAEDGEAETAAVEAMKRIREARRQGKEISVRVEELGRPRKATPRPPPAPVYTAPWSVTNWKFGPVPPGARCLDCGIAINKGESVWRSLRTGEVIHDDCLGI